MSGLGAGGGEEAPRAARTGKRAGARDRRLPTSWADALEARDRPAYWRALEEYLASPGYLEQTAPEFPPGADGPPEAMSRRRFVQLLGASMALAGVTGCVERPGERILPYATAPPEIIPGVPLGYATSMVLDGYATGVVVRTREGRPIKVEGNPDHPASRGAAGVFEQASVLHLYDPHRGDGLTRGGRPAGWQGLAELLGNERPDGGEGLRLLMEPTSSPLRIHLLERVLERHPETRAYFHGPFATPGLGGDARLGGGQESLTPLPDFSRARVVVAFDADFLASGPFHLAHARDFAETRRISSPEGRMSRLYAAESMPTPTGSLADHRLRARVGEMAGLLVALLDELDAPLGEAAVPGHLRRDLPEERRRWVRAAASDLREHRGEGLVVAGEHLPRGIRALAHLANDAAGNVGTTLRYVPSPIHEAGRASHDLRRLAEELRTGEVDTVVVLEGNPVYSAPPVLELGRLLREGPETVYLGLYRDETAEVADWYVPAAHYMESWGDARAYDGTLSTVQPLIAPLAGGRQPEVLLAVLAGERSPSVHALLRERWREEVHPAHGGGEPFERFRERALQRGFVPGTAAAPVTASVEPAALPRLLAELPPPRGGVEVRIVPDPRVHDGRFADNPWLQELPDPVTKLTWDNAALVSPRTAVDLGVETGDPVEVRHGGRAVVLPALPVPGHADGAVTLRAGFGREGGEAVAAGVGVSAFLLRGPGASLFLGGAALERATDGDGEPLPRTKLATTQSHWRVEGRPLALRHTLEEYRENPDLTEHHRGPVESLYPSVDSDADHQWAMTVDLSLCTGCGACVAACQAENNVPVVGKEGVLRGREMHWIRVDRYHRGSVEEPDAVNQPMLCQHCEKAPCEYVCPVNATVHSADGLNEMIYNRCVGTRFCSNNCPYKVRRFNWFDYNERREPRELLVLNPDVTVRDRGVMEKCTYCVQRIRRAGIEARREGREIRDGEVRTACQQTCPMGAIVFGNMLDPDAEVTRRLEEPRVYEALHELGTRPRTRYLARIENPAPELSGSGAADEELE